MGIKTGVTSGTPSKILFGAGVYFSGVTYDEKVAPTEEAIKAAIIGATQDGGTLTVTPTFFTPELDGVDVALADITEKVGETAQLDISFAELTAELASKMVIGAVSETTDKKYDVVTSSALKSGHYYNGFGFYGEFLDGRPIIVLFKRALCTSGFTTDNKSKTNSIFKGTMQCYSDIEYGTKKLPYAIFIRKKNDWVPADVNDLTSA